eukprot:scaffold1097_cov66-Isochrysis_galbana.AAC.3
MPISRRPGPAHLAAESRPISGRSGAPICGRRAYFWGAGLIAPGCGSAVAQTRARPAAPAAEGRDQGRRVRTRPRAIPRGGRRRAPPRRARPREGRAGGPSSSRSRSRALG